MASNKNVLKCEGSWSVIHSGHPPGFATYVNRRVIAKFNHHNMTYSFTDTFWSRPNDSLQAKVQWKDTKHSVSHK